MALRSTLSYRFPGLLTSEKEKPVHYLGVYLVVGVVMLLCDLYDKLKVVE